MFAKATQNWESLSSLYSYQFPRTVLTEFTVLLFWRPEVPNQGVSGAVHPWEVRKKGLFSGYVQAPSCSLACGPITQSSQGFPSVYVYVSKFPFL